jgi:outer membrane protein
MSRVRLTGRGVFPAVLILLPFAGIPCRGQQARSGEIPVFTRQDATQVLTLEQSVAVALERSFDFFRLQQRYLQLDYGLEAARRSLKTHVEFNSVLPGVNQGYTNLLYTDFSGTLALWLFRDRIFKLSSGVSVIQPLITNGSVSLSTSLTGYERSLVTVPPPGTPGTLNDLRYVMPRFSIDFNQPLFQYNRIKGSLRQAQLDLESLQLSYNEVELSRIGEVADDFYELLRRQHQLEIAAEVYQQNQLTYEAVQSAYRLGLVSEMDQLGIQVTLANSRDQLIQAQTRHRTQLLAFNRRIGLPPEEMTWVEIPEHRAIQVDLDRALALARENRSDVRQTGIALEQSRLELQETVSRGRPDLQLNLGFDYTGNSTVTGYGPYDPWSKHLSAGFNPDNLKPNTNVSLTLRIPILDGRENEARVLRGRSEIRVLERQAEETAYELEQAVRARVAAVTASQQRLQIQEQNRTLARSAYEVTRDRYRQGEASLTDLLLAQQRYRETESLFLDALAGYGRDTFALMDITLWDWEHDRAVQRRTEPPRTFHEGVR